MQCDCQTRVKNNLLKKVQEEGKAGPGATVECQNLAVVMTDEMSLQGRVYINYKVTGPNKGYTRGKEVPVMCTFCPFCGKPAVAPKEEKPAEAAKEEKTDAPS